MKAQANLPDTLPGQNVTFLLFGGTELTPQPENQNGLQAFTLQSGIGSGATCAEAPVDGVLIQTPGEDISVQFALNGVEIELGSTAYVQAQAGNVLWMSVIEGQAQVTSGGTTEKVPAGTRTTVALDETGTAIGAPSPAEPYGEDEVRSLPLLPLERSIQVAPPLEIADRTDFVPVGFVITDAISQAGEIDTYTFDARAGQAIFLDGQLSSTPGNIIMELLAPDQTGIADNLYAGGDSGTLLLTQDGTYTLNIRSSVTDITGEYAIQIWDVPAPDRATVNIGDLLSGSIETPGVSDLYTFTAKAGQAIFLDGQLASTPGNIIMELLAPDQTIITRSLYAGGDSGTLTLEQDGDYTLTIDAGQNSATGNYIVQIWDVPAPDRVTVSIGDMLSGSIESPGASDLYTFTASAWQVIFLDGQLASTPGNIIMELIAPDQTLIVRSLYAGGDSGTLTLEQDGDYTLKVDAGQNSATGDYVVQIWGVPELEHTTLEPVAEQRGGTTLTAVARGELAVPGEIDGFWFDARAGQVLTITGLERNVSGNMVYLLRTPDGAEMLSGVWVGYSSDPVVLDQSGSYELLVNGNNSSVTGSYALEIRLEAGGR
jgi:hypothetical protein